MSLDFIAAVDQFMNETTQLADVFLPAATWLERSELVPTIHATYDRLMFRQKVIEPLGESLSDVNIYGKLARRMGFGQYFWKDEDEYLNYLLSPRNITFEDLKKMGLEAMVYSSKVNYDERAVGTDVELTLKIVIKDVYKERDTENSAYERAMGLLDSELARRIYVVPEALPAR